MIRKETFQRYSTVLFQYRWMEIMDCEVQCAKKFLIYMLYKVSEKWQ